MDIEREIRERAKKFDSIIESYLPQPDGEARTLIDAMNYSISAGGKRLRPIMMQASYEMFGGRGEAIRPFMAAIEMIHTYSLVHDDLPAMDNDMLRRGKPTTHAAYGEAMAILAGDGLLNLAYETATKAFLLEPDNPNIARALSVLAKKAGINGMVGGQAADVEGEKNGIPVDGGRMHFIYENKTAALMEGCLMVGAILAGASEGEISQMERAGSCLGIAFQVADDILDVTGDEEKLGKPVGSDEKNGKATSVTLLGLETAKKEVERMSKKAVTILDGCGHDDEFLRELFLCLVHRES